MTRVLALCGGVGGAKLAFGLTRVLAEDELAIVVNPGDDFEHLGLQITPDLDTVMYTLADLADRARGWGLAGETWNFMEALKRLGGTDWFQLGDQDLAMHVERSRRLASGQSLSEVTAHLARSLGLKHLIAPASDHPIRTEVTTDDGDLEFQTYFVAKRCEPRVRAIRYSGAAAARPSPLLERELAREDLSCVIVCPSNPYLSIDPILEIPGLRERLAAHPAPVVAVSPVIGGEAVKGPTAKLMRELGAEPGVTAIADHYAGLLTGLVLDRADAAYAPQLESQGLRTLQTDILMKTDDDRVRLATETLAFAAALGSARQP